jgi:hypothetical protein
MNSKSRIPSFAKSRRGDAISFLDGLVNALWSTNPKTSWPCLTFGELTEKASSILGYEVKPPAVRGYVYRRPDLFERADDSKSVRWRLTRNARNGISALR